MSTHNCVKSFEPLLLSFEAFLLASLSCFHTLFKLALASASTSQLSAPFVDFSVCIFTITFTNIYTMQVKYITAAANQHISTSFRIHAVRLGKPTKPQPAGHHKPEPEEAYDNSSGFDIVRPQATKSWANAAAFRPS